MSAPPSYVSDARGAAERRCCDLGLLRVQFLLAADRDGALGRIGQDDD